MISRILQNFSQVALDFATLNVGNISYHNSTWTALNALWTYCVKSRCLVETNARRALGWNKRQFATKS